MMDDDEKEELLSAATKLVDESERICARIKESQQAGLENLAGQHFGKLMESRSISEGYLGHSDPKLRKAALFLIENHWGLSDKLALTLEKMSFEDTDDDNRAIALCWLARIFKGTKDFRVGKLLAEAVKNESFSKEFRTTAYFGLFELRGLSSERYPKTWSAGFTFPASIDWSFVDSFF